MNLIVLFIAACAFGATTAAPPSPEELQIKSEIGRNISTNQIQFALELFESISYTKTYYHDPATSVPVAGLYSTLFVFYHGANNGDYREKLKKDFGFSPDSRPAELAMVDFVQRSKQIEESEGSTTAIAIFHPADLQFKTDFEEKMNSMLSSNEWHFAIPDGIRIDDAIEKWIETLDIGSFEDDDRWKNRWNDNFRMVVATSLRTKLHFRQYNARQKRVKIYDFIGYLQREVPYMSAIAEVIYGECHKFCEAELDGTKYIKVPWAGVGDRKLWTIFIKPHYRNFHLFLSKNLNKELIGHALLNTNVSLVHVDLPLHFTISTVEDFTKYPYAKPDDESSESESDSSESRSRDKPMYGPPGDAFSGLTDHGRMFTEETSRVSDLTGPIAFYATRSYELIDDFDTPVERKGLRAEHEFIANGDMIIVDVLEDENPIILSITAYNSFERSDPEYYHRTRADEK